MTDSPLKLAVIGACGRMGQRIIALARESAAFNIAAALEAADHPQQGADIGNIAGIGDIGVPVTTEPGAACDVLIDFTVPASTQAWTAWCLKHPTPYVVGTTGLAPEQVAQLETAAARMPVLFAPNMSLGMNLLFKLVGEVARCLGDDYDIEVSETHHRFKRDAPSGTALELARKIAVARDWPFPDSLDHGRCGKDALRRPGRIGMHALRLGDTVGEHTVSFGALGETVELRHSAHTRDTFVRGALRGAEWLVKQPSGLYSMADVLGL